MSHCDDLAKAHLHDPDHGLEYQMLAFRYYRAQNKRDTWYSDRARSVANSYLALRQLEEAERWFDIAHENIRTTLALEFDWRHQISDHLINRRQYDQVVPRFSRLVDMLGKGAPISDVRCRCLLNIVNTMLVHRHVSGRPVNVAPELANSTIAKLKRLRDGQEKSSFLNWMVLSATLANYQCLAGKPIDAAATVVEMDKGIEASPWGEHRGYFHILRMVALNVVAEMPATPEGHKAVDRMFEAQFSSKHVVQRYLSQMDFALTLTRRHEFKRAVKERNAAVEFSKKYGRHLISREEVLAEAVRGQHMQWCADHDYPHCNWAPAATQKNSDEAIDLANVFHDIGMDEDADRMYNLAARMYLSNKSIRYPYGLFRLWRRAATGKKAPPSRHKEIQDYARLLKDNIAPKTKYDIEAERL